MTDIGVILLRHFYAGHKNQQNQQQNNQNQPDMSEINVIDITYKELKNSMDSSLLIAGQFYKITDYQTMHQIPYTEVINTGTIEPLICLALADNIISNNVYSPLFPKDRIEYDINNNVCEDNQTARPGFITRRIDENRNDCSYDHKNVKFRRWALDLSGMDAWTDTTYSIYAIIQYNDIVYRCIKDITEARGKSPDQDSEYWNWVIDKTQKWCCQLRDNQWGGINVNGDANDYTDYYTFNCIGDCYDNVIEYGKDGLNNIIFIGRNCYNNHFEINYYDSTFASFYNCDDNEFGGDWSACNIFSGDIYQNIFGANFTNNSINSNFIDNLIGADSNGNAIGANFNGNSIGVSFNGNSIGANSSNNLISTFFQYNIIGEEFQGNSIDTNFNSNSISIHFCNNSIGANFNGNSIGENFTKNSIGIGVMNINLEIVDLVQGNRFENNLDLTGIVFGANANLKLIGDYDTIIYRTIDGNYKMRYYTDSGVVIQDLTN